MSLNDSQRDDAREAHERAYEAVVDLREIADDAADNDMSAHISLMESALDEAYRRWIS